MAATTYRLISFRENHIPILIYSFLLTCLLGCAKTESTPENIPGDEPLVAENPLLILRSSAETGITFRNTIKETFEMNITTHINTYNGGGVAVLDANKDGLQDLYFISCSGENKFYLNQGDFNFKDITATSGLGSSDGFEVAVTVVDINADTWPDIYICRSGPETNEARRNKLFINNRDLTFTEEASKYHLDDPSASMGANFFDYDNDGDLDLYLLNYPVDFSFSSKINVKPNSRGDGVVPVLDPISPYDTDRLYRNDGPVKPDGSGGFTDVSKKAGIWNFGFGLSVSIEDFNQDGWMDVYVANDFIQPDILYINNKDGSFTDQLGKYFKHTTQHTMGTDLADFDNDGLFDLFALDMLSKTQYRKKTILSTNSQNKYNTLIRNGYFPPVVRNALQRNNGNSTFSDVACMANVFQTDWSWSGLMTDLDNDGWKDILVTNGYHREVANVDFINFTFAEIKAKGEIKNQFKDVADFLNLIPQYKLNDFVFRNKGDLTYEDKSGDWMTTPPSWSNGATTADLDNDGDMDYIVNNIEDEPFIYDNQCTELKAGQYLQFVFNGPPANPLGTGAQVRIYYGNEQQYAMLSPTRGIFSSVEYLLHFGLGPHDIVDRIHVTWPDGKMETLINVPASQRITLDYTNATETGSLSNPKPATWYKDITHESKFNFTHRENDYIDFESTFMMPWALSDLGPLCATADVNGDGLTDVYIGNSFGKAGGLYAQQGDGTLKLISRSVWEADSLYEDHGSLFFDADLDGDQDLLVISGGYESVSPEAWRHRLYINDNGKSFIPAHNALPRLKDVCLRAVALDYDGDKDLDLFLGGRVVPGKYPDIPESYILRNDRNKFVDVTAEVSPDFGSIGMISDLKVGNIDSDPESELIVVGEWMPVTVFNIANSKLEKVDLSKIGLDQSNGFWNCLSLADMDGDGDMDIVTGNIGLNTHYRASFSHPVQCYVNDIDKNGSLDPIITYFEGDLCYPMVQKEVLIKQVPVMKKRYLYGKTYGTATIEDILGKDKIKESTILNCYMLESGWWQNENGRFIFRSFPNQAQISPVQGIIIGDLDGDQLTDVFVAGNKYTTEVETGRLDAGNGALLKGNGEGEFTWLNNLLSGIWADLDVRDLALLKGPNLKTRILIANNNGHVQLYEYNKK